LSISFPSFPELTLHTSLRNLLLMVWCIAILILPKLQELLRIFMSNLQLVSDVDVHVIEPLRSILIALILIVDRVQNAIGTKQAMQNCKTNVENCPEAVSQMFSLK
jgi:hypothetical protein